MITPQPDAHSQLLAAYHDADPDGRRALLAQVQADYLHAHQARDALMRAALTDGWPVGWIAEAMGLSRQRVSQFKNDRKRMA